MGCEMVSRKKRTAMERFVKQTHRESVQIDRDWGVTRESVCERLQAIRLQEDVRYGFASGIGDFSLETLVDRATHSLLPCDSEMEMFPPEISSLATPHTKPQLDEAGRVQMSLEIAHAIQQAFPAWNADCYFDYIHTEKTIQNQQARAQSQREFYQLEVLLQDQEGRRPLLDFVLGTQERLEAGMIIQTLRKYILHSTAVSTGLSGEFSVVFTPWALKGFWVQLAQLFDLRWILRGISPLGQMRGTRILDARLSMTDDGGTSPGIMGEQIDDEGIPTQATPLIVQGKVAGYLADYRTSAQAGLQTTGNCVRTMNGLPGIQYTNLLISGGTDQLKNMTEKVGTLILSQVNGNVTPDGFFDFNIELGYRVRETGLEMITGGKIFGNFFHLMNQIEQISSEREWVEGRILSPYIRFARIKID